MSDRRRMSRGPLKHGSENSMHGDENPPTDFTHNEWVTTRDALFNGCKGKRRTKHRKAYDVAKSMNKIQEYYGELCEIVMMNGRKCAEFYVDGFLLSAQERKWKMNLSEKLGLVEERIGSDWHDSLHELREMGNTPAHENEFYPKDKPVVVSIVYKMAYLIAKDLKLLPRHERKASAKRAPPAQVPLAQERRMSDRRRMSRGPLKHGSENSMHGDENPPTDFTHNEWVTTRDALFNGCKGKRRTKHRKAYDVAKSMNKIQEYYGELCEIVMMNGRKCAEFYVDGFLLSAQERKWKMNLSEKLGLVEERIGSDWHDSLHELREMGNTPAHENKFYPKDKPVVVTNVYFMAYWIAKDLKLLPRHERKASAKRAPPAQAPPALAPPASAKRGVTLSEKLLFVILLYSILIGILIGIPLCEIG